VLEGRDRPGGTWDLFRYPGVRSDSDMFTLGYDFKPWRGKRAIAEGADILAYLKDAAAEHGIDAMIRYGHHVEAADWDAAASCWQVQVRAGDTVQQFRCRFLYLCGGYYRYDKAHRPDLAGAAQFTGLVVHPQFWPEGLDVAGKRILVIGSGATAVTLVPALAARGARVTMVQRSPSWLISRPGIDKLANGLRRLLPEALVYRLVRLRNVALSSFFYGLTRTRPAVARRQIMSQLAQEVDSPEAIAAHFTPRYNVWDQRLCLVPDSDFFQALRSGQADVVIGTIRTLTETGLEMESGQPLEADIIVTATGLALQAFGGVKVSVGGAPVVPCDHFSYKGVMLNDVPNLAVSMGYINASWTLRSDLVARFVIRLLRHMKAKNAQIVVPVAAADVVADGLSWNLASGYVQRGKDAIPRVGNRAPWRALQNYRQDRKDLLSTPLEDGELCFRSAP
jgi:cation diffusion facilitator CzcD-associated flavoprotein CzcO